MTFKEAAEKILTEFSRPLTATELVNIAFERDLIESSGNTPEATMAATLYSDLKTNNKTIFQKVGKGKFALKKQTESATDPLLIITRQNNLVRRSLFQELVKMDPSQFEYLVADLLQKMRYEDVEVTGKSGDEGVDVIGTLTAGGLTSVPTVVQVKQYKTSNIGPKYIRELRGSAKVGQRGLIVTLSKFTEGAKKEAKAEGKMPVSLVDGERLINLLIENQVGVKEQELVILSIDQEYFENSDLHEESIFEKDKFRVMWPLPGGGGNYLETLDRLLHLVENGDGSPRKH